jgi:DNA-binding response OmpR family regulator
MDVAPLTDVAMLRWPAEAERRERLRGERRPRLLLVEADAPAPVAVDPLEDWIRLPAPEPDLRARVEGLVRIAVDAAVDHPRVDEDGLLRFASRWVSLPPVESRLASALVDRLGSVVSRDVLTRSAWPEGDPPGRNALDVHMARLRRRIGQLGLSITTVRSRGYLLDVDAAY